MLIGMLLLPVGCVRYPSAIIPIVCVLLVHASENSRKVPDRETARVMATIVLWTPLFHVNRTLRRLVRRLSIEICPASFPFRGGGKNNFSVQRFSAKEKGEESDGCCILPSRK